VLIYASELLSVRRKALRKRAWFRVLGNEERILVNLTIRCVKVVRSTLLAGMIKCIVAKLEDAMKSRTVEFVKSVGSSLARKVAYIAVSWGNSGAKEWASDVSFARYLGIIRMNTSRVFEG